jgi:hypothetical protein
MKKFAVIVKENGNIHIAIEIVSEDTLKHSDGKDFATTDDYLKNTYGEEHLVAWYELDGNAPAKILIYKEGVFSTPSDKEERDKDYTLSYI